MNTAEHQRAAELLPWLVNGTLQGTELAWLHEHLADCAQCRAELQRQRLVREAVARQPVVELAPQASFKQLWSRIESEANTATRTSGGVPAARPAARVRRRLWGVPAGLLAGAAAAALVGALLWPGPSPDGGQRFHTVSAAMPAAAPGHIRVVFAENVTVADIKSILGSAHLEASAGPTPAGVFTLRASGQASDGELEALLQTLRADPRVRFAELR
jgi:hypothetical protein